jgi:hypothetical protein
MWVRRGQRRAIGPEQNLDQMAVVDHPVFQDEWRAGFLKNKISKLFRPQPFEIPRNAQGNVFENLEASKNI